MVVERTCLKRLNLSESGSVMMGTIMELRRRVRGAMARHSKEGHKLRLRHQDKLVGELRDRQEAGPLRCPIGIKEGLEGV